MYNIIYIFKQKDSKNDLHNCDENVTSIIFPNFYGNYVIWKLLNQNLFYYSLVFLDIDIDGVFERVLKIISSDCWIIIILCQF